MEEALRIALNLEALDNSKEVESAAISEKYSKKEKFVKVASQVGPAGSDAGQPLPDEAIKQLQESIQQCCSQMAQMQQDVTDLKQRSTASTNPYAAFDQQGSFRGYQYPAAWEYLVQYGPHSIGQPGRSAGQCYPTGVVGPTPQQLDYTLKRGSQSHVAASAEAPPQSTNQSSKERKLFRTEWLH